MPMEKKKDNRWRDWIDKLANKQERLELIAFGCNLHARKKLKETLSQYGIKTFQFFEYFMDKPVRAKKDKICLALAEVAKDETNAENTEPLNRIVFFPFLKRLLFEFPFFPDPLAVFNGQTLKQGVECESWPRKIHFSSKLQSLRTDKGSVTNDNMATLDNIYDWPFWIPEFQAPVGKEVLKAFKDIEGNNSYSPKWFEEHCPKKYLPEEEDNVLQGIDNLWWKENVWKKIIEKLRKPGAQNPETQILEYNLTSWFWENSCANSIPCLIAAPITSGNALHGYFILIYTHVLKEPGVINNDDSKKLYKEILEILYSLSFNTYAPVLALFQHSCWERDVDELKDKKDRVIIEKIEDIHGRAEDLWKDSSDEMEKNLYRLWKKLYDNRNKGTNYIKDNLIFAKKSYASPGMLEIIKTILKMAPQLKEPKNSGDELPCSLIYGEPGSGKESIAKLVAILSDYFGCEIISVNMAALKPNESVGPQIMGVKPLLKVFGIRSESSLSGFLTRKADNNKRVYILDELNSLDVDLQGILLRILEQGQVTPLFDIEPINVKHLIIGIVNEDPKESIREAELRMIRRLEEFFGKMVRAILHDIMAKGRRLRPDLFYRMNRSLYVEIPSLSDRREDIPIIFYDLFKKELKNIKKVYEESHVIVDYEALGELMSLEHTWPGNIRELQNVVKKTVAKVVEEEERKSINGKITHFKVRYEHVLRAFN